MDLVAAADVVLRDFKDTDNQLQFSMFILTNSEAILPVQVVLKASEVHNFSVAQCIATTYIVCLST